MILHNNVSGTNYNDFVFFSIQFQIQIQCGIYKTTTHSKVPLLIYFDKICIFPIKYKKKTTLIKYNIN